MVEFKTAYSDRIRVITPTGGDTMTQQNFKAECDINTILKKYQKTGLVTHVSQHNGDYVDLSTPVDYQTALNVVINAQASFDSLPSTIRKQFNNDPGTFVAFACNPENNEALIEMGLKKRSLPDLDQRASPADLNQEVPPEA